HRVSSVNGCSEKQTVRGADGVVICCAQQRDSDGSYTTCWDSIAKGGHDHEPRAAAGGHAQRTTHHAHDHEPQAAAGGHAQRTTHHAHGNPQRTPSRRRRPRTTNHAHDHEPPKAATHHAHEPRSRTRKTN